MKRFACLLMALCLSAVSFAQAETGLNGYDCEAEAYEYVSLGSWKQSLEGETQPILWRVLWVKDGRAMLMSERILGNHRIHDDDVEYYYDFACDFRQTELFAYLNGEFLQTAFTADEQALLETTDELGTVYLPAAEDLKSRDYGFGSDGKRQAYGSEWALTNGLFRYSNKSSPYWTRTPSKTEKGGSLCTKVHGAIGYIRCVVVNLGYRPCVTLKTDECDVVSGAGTLENPYCVATYGILEE